MSAELSTVEMAEVVKREIVALSGGFLGAEYMYVLSDEPNEQGMTRESHGWSDGDCDVELVAEEAGDLLDRALERAIEKHPEIGGRHDWINSVVLGFYEK